MMLLKWIKVLACWKWIAMKFGKASMTAYMNMEIPLVLCCRIEEIWEEFVSSLSENVAGHMLEVQVEEPLVKEQASLDALEEEKQIVVAVELLRKVCASLLMRMLVEATVHWAIGKVHEFVKESSTFYGWEEGIDRYDEQAEDLYDINPKEGTQYCEQLWNDAIEKVRLPLNENLTFSVWRLLWLCFGLEYARAAIFKVSWLIGLILEDPILIQGSVRFNLDPFEVYTDVEIYEALERVHLLPKIQGLDKGLDSLIAQNGQNFSVGQRQLICLARSLLRRQVS
ncbi:hypothetical protein L7F22_031477 [Adiantum nelumboides]|nr:hypothetical protein [Adiantum nelumboides]